MTKQKSNGCSLHVQLHVHDEQAMALLSSSHFTTQFLQAFNRLDCYIVLHLVPQSVNQTVRDNVTEFVFCEQYFLIVPLSGFRNSSSNYINT